MTEPRAQVFYGGDVTLKNKSALRDRMSSNKVPDILVTTPDRFYQIMSDPLQAHVRVETVLSATQLLVTVAPDQMIDLGLRYEGCRSAQRFGCTGQRRHLDAPVCGEVCCARTAHARW